MLAHRGIVRACGSSCLRAVDVAVVVVGAKLQVAVVHSICSVLVVVLVVILTLFGFWF